MKKFSKVLSIILLIASVAFFVPEAVLVQIAYRDPSFLNNIEVEGNIDLNQYLNEQFANLSTIVAAGVLGLGILFFIIWRVLEHRETAGLNRGSNRGKKIACRVIGLILLGIGALTLITSILGQLGAPSISTADPTLMYIIGGSLAGVGLILFIISLCIKVYEYNEDEEGASITYKGNLAMFTGTLYGTSYEQGAELLMTLNTLNNEGFTDVVSVKDSVITVSSPYTPKERKLQYKRLQKGYSSDEPYPLDYNSDFNDIFSYQTYKTIKGKTVTKTKVSFTGEKAFYVVGGSNRLFYDKIDVGHYINHTRKDETYYYVCKNGKIIKDSNGDPLFYVVRQNVTFKKEPVFVEEKGFYENDPNTVTYHGPGFKTKNDLHPYGEKRSDGEICYLKPLELFPQNEPKNCGDSKLVTMIGKHRFTDTNAIYLEMSVVDLSTSDEDCADGYPFIMISIYLKNGRKAALVQVYPHDPYKNKDFDCVEFAAYCSEEAATFLEDFNFETVKRMVEQSWNNEIPEIFEKYFIDGIIASSETRKENDQKKLRKYFTSLFVA